LLSHPKKKIRDTARYKPFREKNKGRMPALRKLAKHYLGENKFLPLTAGITIQEGEHSSVDDARAAMALYRMHRKEWERELKNRFLKKTEDDNKSGEDGGSGRGSDDEDGSNSKDAETVHENGHGDDGAAKKRPLHPFTRGRRFKRKRD
jgi:RNA exonuclease 4